jgi:hypothetical protein
MERTNNKSVICNTSSYSFIWDNSDGSQDVYTYYVTTCVSYVDTLYNDFDGGDGGYNYPPDPTQDKLLTMPPPPEVPIADMQKFLSCFNINQPANLSVFAQTMFGGNGVGHSFISITQGNNTMTFGFYPKYSFPQSGSGPGIFGDNGGHAYSYGWNAGQISATQLQQIIAQTLAFSQSNYGLTNNNCSDFVNYVLQIEGLNINASGIDTPNTIAGLISPYAQSQNGNAPQTHRTCP